MTEQNHSGLSVYCNRCGEIPRDVRIDVFSDGIRITCKQCGESEGYP